MILSDKDPAETITVTFDFTGVAETVVSATVEATVIAGKTDDSPSAIVSVQPSISGALVMQRITGGQAGTVYELCCLADDADGEKYVLTAALPVRTARPC